MPHPKWRTLLFCATNGWLFVAQAAPRTELEVLGQIAIHAEVEPTAEGTQVVLGRLSDETGRPVAGTVTVVSGAGRSVAAEPCPWLGPRPGDPVASGVAHPVGVVHVNPDGEFCFVTEANKGLLLKAGAPHFLEATHDLDLGLERALARPRFVQAPQTIELHESQHHVVQILGRSDQKPPEGSRLSLSLRCSEDFVVGEVALDESRVQRFEFDAPAQLSPGLCQWVATSSAPTRSPLVATRSVLVKDKVLLSVTEQAQDQGMAVIALAIRESTKRSAPGTLSEGLVEARENGAFVGLSPVRQGGSHLELELGPSEREISLSYIPSSSAYVPGDPLRVMVPRASIAFQWAGVHSAGLLLFAFWLVYAWLRPSRSVQASSVQPPKKALVQGFGTKSGPVAGLVLDAHTGAPISGARLVLSAVGPETTTPLETCLSSEAGRFRFETRIETQPMVRLEATGSEHMTLRSVVKDSQVTVHLTEKRRAAIQALVTWARKAGRPFHRSPSATPGSVERVALRQKAEATAEWARAVGRAAYAEEVPSEDVIESLKAPELFPPVGSSRTSES